MAWFSVKRGKPGGLEPTLNYAEKRDRSSSREA